MLALIYEQSGRRSRSVMAECSWLYLQEDVETVRNILQYVMWDGAPLEDEESSDSDQASDLSPPASL